ncbi:MAG: methionyl-tRNA formyltransferase [Myxococcota bacterium]
MPLRIALFGQADLGRETLDRLLTEGHEIVGVFAPPETRRPDALAARAQELGLPLAQRRYFQTRAGQAIRAALESYRTLDAELNVLASFTSFLPSEITDAARHRSLCFHPSLLPRFRGGNALQWQIILGEAETGVSIFVPDAGVDTGPIVLQKGGVKIEPGDTAGTLFFHKLAPLGIEAIVEAVRAIDRGRAKLRLQDESRATHQGLVSDSDAAVDLEAPPEQIDRLLRGCDPQPGAYLRQRGAKIRLFGTRLLPGGGGAPGRVVGIDDEGIVLALEGARLRITRVRADRGKETAVDFAKRSGLAVGERLTSG